MPVPSRPTPRTPVPSGDSHCPRTPNATPFVRLLEPETPLLFLALLSPLTPSPSALSPVTPGPAPLLSRIHRSRPWRGLCQKRHCFLRYHHALRRLSSKRRRRPYPQVAHTSKDSERSSFRLSTEAKNPTLIRAIALANNTIVSFAPAPHSDATLRRKLAKSDSWLRFNYFLIALNPGSRWRRQKTARELTRGQLLKWKPGYWRWIDPL